MLEKLTTSIKLGIAGLGLLALVGCETKATVTDSNKQNFTIKSEYTTISGIPLSVEHNSQGYTYARRLAIVVDVDDKKIFAYNPRYNTEKFLDAATIIQSEMNDGDNEAIELTGRYESPTTFKIKAVRANGFEVKF